MNAPTLQKDRDFSSLSFFTRLAAWYGVLHFLGVLSGTKIAFLREEGGTRQGFPEANEMSLGGSLRSVTEGARVTLGLNLFYRNALSFTRLRRELPSGGSLLFMLTESPSAFPDKHCFCEHKSDTPHKCNSALLYNQRFKLLCCSDRIKATAVIQTANEIINIGYIGFCNGMLFFDK